MRRTPIAHVIFPRHSLEIPVPTFAMDAARMMAAVPDLELEILMPLPVRALRKVQDRSRIAQGARAWPEGIDEVLAKLEPRPTLIPYVPVPRRSVESAAVAISAALLLKKKADRPRVITGTFLDEGGVAAVAIARALSAKSIAVACGSDARSLIQDPHTPNRVMAKRSKETVDHADALVAVSEDLAKILDRFGRTATVVHFTADPKRFPWTPLPSGPKVVLFVGRLSMDKGVDLLLEAFARIQDKAAVLHLVGARAPDLDVEAETLRLGISERVKLIGELRHWEPALPEAYQKASCFVLPSRAEGFPAVLIEALLSGRPVVATDVGGVKEIVNAKRGVGALVEKDNVGALTRALDAVLSDCEQGLWDPAKLHDYALPMSWAGSLPRLEKLTRRLIAEAEQP
ncbi:MAG: glycosyltransferase [Myxococcota bacterium]